MDRRTRSIRLLVDGSNVLKGRRGPDDWRSLAARMARVAGGPGGAGRGGAGRGEITLILDGHPPPGPREVPAGVRIRWSGDGQADDILVGLVEREPVPLRDRLVVITDDADLRGRISALGGRTERTAWLEPPPAPRLRHGGTDPGRREASHDFDDPAADPSDADEPRWDGSTRKKGNPRRAPRRR